MASLLNLSGGSLLGKGLPYDAEIEYLTGGREQYIDTGVVPTVNMRAILSASDIRARSEGVFGSRVGTTNSMYGLLATGSVLRFDYGGSYYNVDGYMNERHSYCLLGDQLRVVIDNNSVATLVSSTINCQYTIHLFGFNKGGIHANRVNNMNVYSFSLLDGDTVIMDLKPVRIGQVGYMYDKVSGQLFGNSGTGDFILGPDKTN